MSSIRAKGLVVLAVAYISAGMATISSEKLSYSEKWWVFATINGFIGLMVAGPMGER